MEFLVLPVLGSLSQPWSVFPPLHAAPRSDGAPQLRQREDIVPVYRHG